MDRSRKVWAWAVGSCVAVLAGCSTAPEQREPAIGSSPWAAESKVVHRGSAASGWRHFRLPGKSPTQFDYTREDGRNAIAVTAVSSASLLRNAVRVEPADLGRLDFSWKVPHLIPGADMASRQADDSPVRVILTFEGDRSRLSARDAMLSELMRTLMGEELPYATLMYVWCNNRAPGSLIHNSRTDRIRTLVVESGPRKLNQWLDYERDIRADFQRAFGEAPGTLVGIGVMSDSDNTGATARAWYGPLRLGAARRAGN